MCFSVSRVQKKAAVKHTSGSRCLPGNRALLNSVIACVCIADVAFWYDADSEARCLFLTRGPEGRARSLTASVHVPIETTWNRL